MTNTDHSKSDRELLEDLGIDLEQEKKSARTPREERVIAGFEEIQRFVAEHGHPPGHGENKDIFERLYAIRLDRIRQQEECRNLVEDIDHQGLLSSAMPSSDPTGEYRTDAELLADLGIETSKEDDITHLKHVRSQAEKRAAEEIASRIPCKDFAKFRPLFDKVQSDLQNGLVKAKLLKDQKGRSIMAEINAGDWFILNGQKAYVAQLSDERIHGCDKNEYRLRVIFDNRTESNLLLRSLQKALWEDDAGRKIVSHSAGPLFDDSVTEGDLASGTVYVLRSESTDPGIAKNRDVIHKIGVTGGKVEKRIANAKLDPTFLLAGVEVVATYKLYNINRSKLENMIHKFFEDAKLDIEIRDRFGNPVEPREWFWVPLPVIDEVIEKIQDGTITSYRYDVETASLVKVAKV